MAVNVPGKNLLYISCHFSMTNMFCIYLVGCHDQYRYHYLPTSQAPSEKALGHSLKPLRVPGSSNTTKHLAKPGCGIFQNPFEKFRLQNLDLEKDNQQFFCSAPNSKGVLKRHLLPPITTHTARHSEKIPKSLDNSHIRRHPKKVS